MPIVRKIIPVGKTSKAVIIPKSWLELYERETGQQIREVKVEVNKILKIQPVISKETDK
jgi:antitoxin component of MazEF toxin-antitoxin module